MTQTRNPAAKGESQKLCKLVSLTPFLIPVLTSLSINHPQYFSFLKRLIEMKHKAIHVWFVQNTHTASRKRAELEGQTTGFSALQLL